MSQLSLSLLGTPEIHHLEQILKFRTRKTLALLVYLTVEGGMHSREKLINLLWPDLDETQGRTILRRTLALLREVLEEAIATPDETHLIVERNALGIRSTSPIVSDVQQLNKMFTHISSRHSTGKAHGDERHLLVTQLQKILHLVRGTFLEGFSLPDASAFDTWMSTQREMFRYRLNVLFDSLSTLQMEGGQIADAIETTTRWVNDDVGNELAARKLMQLYFIAGKRHEALHVYETTYNWLLHELNVKPAPETIALAERIRREPPSPLIMPKQQVSSIRLDGPLIGRAEEYTTLIECYQRAQQQATQFVILEGEAGMGKTRLVTDFLGWATTQGADVFHSQGVMNGDHFAYQLVIDALRPQIEQENAPDDILGDPWLGELSRILPELRERYPDLPANPIDDITGQTRLFEAIARLGQAWASRRPLVLFFDDFQWVDNASRDVILYVARQWTKNQLPILLITSVRTDILSTIPDVQTWLLTLKNALSIQTISLKALRFEDIAQWVHHLDPHAFQLQSINTLIREADLAPTIDQPFVQWLFSKTHGQPLYITELLRTLLERQMLKIQTHPDGTCTIDTSVTASDIVQWHHILPAKIHDTIRLRLVNLTPNARLLLSAASELCSNFTFELLCQVAELYENEALQALDELINYHLLNEQINTEISSEILTYTFSHDTLREVVYLETSVSKRRIFHQRALDSLQATNVPVAVFAYYAQGAGRPPQEVARWNLKAGDEAMQTFAVRDALYYYEQAQQLLAEEHETLGLPSEESTTGLPTRDLHRLYLHLGKAYELTNALAQAYKIYQRLLTSALQTHEPLMKEQALNSLAALVSQETHLK